MAKKIRWSPLAERKFDEILEYWTKRNKSETFSEKLIDLFEDATQLIANFPPQSKLLLEYPTRKQNMLWMN